MSRWKNAIELPGRIFLIILDFSCENKRNAYKNLQNAIWVDKNKANWVETYQIQCFSAIWVDKIKEIELKHNDFCVFQLSTSNFDEIWHFDLRNRFTETCSSDTSEEQCYPPRRHARPAHMDQTFALKRSYVGFPNYSCEYERITSRKSLSQLDREPEPAGSGNGFAE